MATVQGVVVATLLLLTWLLAGLYVVIRRVRCAKNRESYQIAAEDRTAVFPDIRDYRHLHRLKVASIILDAVQFSAAAFSLGANWNESTGIPRVFRFFLLDFGVFYLSFALAVAACLALFVLVYLTEFRRAYSNTTALLAELLAGTLCFTVVRVLLASWVCTDQGVLLLEQGLQCWSPGHTALAVVALCLLLPYYLIAVSWLVWQMSHKSYVSTPTRVDGTYFTFYQQFRVIYAALSIVLVRYVTTMLVLMLVLLIALQVYGELQRPWNVDLLQHVRRWSLHYAAWLVACGLVADYIREPDNFFPYMLLSVGLAMLSTALAFSEQARRQSVAFALRSQPMPRRAIGFAATPSTAPVAPAAVPSTAPIAISSSSVATPPPSAGSSAPIALKRSLSMRSLSSEFPASRRGGAQTVIVPPHGTAVQSSPLPTQLRAPQRASTAPTVAAPRHVLRVEPPSPAATATASASAPVARAGDTFGQAQCTPVDDCSDGRAGSVAGSNSVDTRGHASAGYDDGVACMGATDQFGDGIDVADDHDGPGASDDHDDAGATDDHDGAGAADDHSGVGASDDHDVAGAADDHNGAGASDDHDGAGATDDHDGAGAADDHSGAGASDDHDGDGAADDHNGSIVANHHDTSLGHGTCLDNGTSRVQDEVDKHDGDTRRNAVLEITGLQST